jgi:hypothetical protein
MPIASGPGSLFEAWFGATPVGTREILQLDNVYLSRALCFLVWLPEQSRSGGELLRSEKARRFAA